jgi:hypothetical protein
VDAPCVVAVCQLLGRGRCLERAHQGQERAQQAQVRVRQTQQQAPRDEDLAGEGERGWPVP